MIRYNHGIFDYKRPVIAAAASYPTNGLVSRFTYEDSLSDTYGSYSTWRTYGNNTQTWSYDSNGKVGKGFKTNASGQGTSGGIIENITDSGLYTLPSGTNTVSISMWIKITTSNADLTYPMSFLQGDGQARSPWGFAGASYTPGGGIAGCLMGSNVTTTYNYDFRDSNWHHFVMTYDGTTEKIYVDNTERISYSRSSWLTNFNRIVVGGTNLGSWPILGLFDQVYFYNRALNTTEVSQLYNSGNGI